VYPAVARMLVQVARLKLAGIVTSSIAVHVLNNVGGSVVRAGVSTMDVSAVQKLNTVSSANDCKLLGSIIEDKDVQVSNEYESINVTELGITILVSAVQYWKVPFNRLLSKGGSVIESKPIHPWNAVNPIDVTPEGITRVVSAVQETNTFAAIALRDAENVMLDSAVQP
jgi:hypothetical protein